MKPAPDARPEAGEQAACSPTKTAYRADPILQALASGVRWQAVVAVVLALLALSFSRVAAYSTLFGGLAVYVPALLFTWFVGRRIGADSGTFLHGAALAEFGKLFLTGVLCAVVFIWVRPLAPLAFFGGMIAVLVTGWVGLGRALR